MSLAIAPARLRTIQASALLPVALLTIAFALLRPAVDHIPDVSWLITVCERVLDGQRLYVDIIENNPPASVWLYLPAVYLARMAHLRPETLVNLQFLALACGALALCGGVLARGGLLRHHNRAWLACLALALLTLLPRDSFGEREHAIALLLLPSLGCLALRAGGMAPSGRQILICGVLAGLAVCIKPHFALALVAAAVAAAAAARAWRLLLAPELLIAALVLAVYAACVVWLAPDYIANILPRARLTYLPVRLPVFELLLSSGMAALALALLFNWQVAAGRRPSAPVAVLLAAALGAMLAYLAQGKGWAYQSLPMVLFAALALAIAATAPGAARQQIAGRLAIVCAVCAFYLGDARDAPALRAAIAALQPRPSMMILSSEITVGHPLVRQLGGAWAGRECALLVVAGALHRLGDEVLDADTAAKVKAAGAEALDNFAADVERARPDIVLVDMIEFDWSGMVSSRPALAAALAGYRDRGTFDKVRIMQRSREAEG